MDPQEIARCVLKVIGVAFIVMIIAGVYALVEAI